MRCKSRYRWYPLVATLFMLWHGHWANAQTVSLIGADFSGRLYDVSISTGDASNVRNSGVIPLSGVAFGPSGLLFALNTRSGSPANALFLIEPSTGSTELVGVTGLTSLFEGDLDFDPTSGLLYGIQDAPNGGPPPRSLFTMNTETGEATVLGSISGGDLSAMAFDGSGSLWVLNTFQEELVRVDKSNGNTLASVSLSLPLGAVAGMDFHPITGELFVADGLTDGTDTLYTLDTETGVLTIVGSTGLTDGLAGLEFTPEPGALFVLLAGAPFIRHRWSVACGPGSMNCRRCELEAHR